MPFIQTFWYITPPRCFWGLLWISRNQADLHCPYRFHGRTHEETCFGSVVGWARHLFFSRIKSTRVPVYLEFKIKNVSNRGLCLLNRYHFPQYTAPIKRYNCIITSVASFYTLHKIAKHSTTTARIMHVSQFICQSYTLNFRETQCDEILMHSKVHRVRELVSMYSVVAKY